MQVLSSKAAAEFLRNKVKSKTVEEFWAVALNPQCKVIRVKMIFRGTVDFCLVHPRDIFRFALKTNASSIIVAHNHPSGSPRPSRADIYISHKLKQAGVLLEIPLVDHIILGGSGHYSFADHYWKSSGETQIQLL